MVAVVAGGSGAVVVVRGTAPVEVVGIVVVAVTVMVDVAGAVTGGVVVAVVEIDVVVAIVYTKSLSLFTHKKKSDIYWQCRFV